MWQKKNQKKHLQWFVKNAKFVWFKTNSQIFSTTEHIALLMLKSYASVIHSENDDDDQKKKQFNEIIKSHENNMYYFDIRKIISTILSSIWTSKAFHIDITKIVNNSFEYWHLFLWKSSIRTCSQNYVTYFNLTFIFFFDFVRFKHVNETKIRKCIEQIMFFDRNRKSQSFTYNHVLLKIRLVQTAQKIQNLYFVNIDFYSIFSQINHIFIENNDYWIEFQQIIFRFFQFVFHKMKTKNQNQITDIRIESVFNVKFHIIRSTDLLHFLRTKLKITNFEKKILIFRLQSDIQSCSFVIFIDAFDLYKNMYQILIAMYVLSIALCNFDRQKNQNSFVFILNFHDASFKNIINNFRIEIKIFDHDCQLNLNEKQTWIWISIVIFLNDMKQQQEFAKFFESKTIKCCRFCDVDKKNRKNLNRNVVLNDRYHYQILKLRYEASKFDEIIKKKNLQHYMNCHWSFHFSLQ